MLQILQDYHICSLFVCECVFVGVGGRGESFRTVSFICPDRVDRYTELRSDTERTQIAKAIGSISIWHWSDATVPDSCVSNYDICCMGGVSSAISKHKLFILSTILYIKFEPGNIATYIRYYIGQRYVYNLIYHISNYKHIFVHNI